MNLQAYGVETLLPRIQKSVVRLGRRVIRIEPLFPRYLFATCEALEIVHRIRNTRGVSRVLGMGGLPTPVDAAIISEIQSRIGPAGFVELTHAPRPGDHVRVVTGPFRDFVGVFESTMRASERVGVLLRIVNGQFKVIVHADAVETVF